MSSGRANTANSPNGLPLLMFMVLERIIEKQSPVVPSSIPGHTATPASAAFPATKS